MDSLITIELVHKYTYVHLRSDLAVRYCLIRLATLTLTHENKIFYGLQESTSTVRKQFTPQGRRGRPRNLPPPLLPPPPSLPARAAGQSPCCARAGGIFLTHTIWWLLRAVLHGGGAARAAGIRLWRAVGLAAAEAACGGASSHRQFGHGVPNEKLCLGALDHRSRSAVGPRYGPTGGLGGLRRLSPR
jgi:hypothetical protein